jgi:hypothetical protein
MLEDHVDYDLPGGMLGRAVGGGMVQRDLARMFAWRHARTRHDLAHHARFPGERLRVAVSGTNGLVGGAFVPFLTTGGHDVRRIVRGSADPARGDVAWDGASNAFDAAALEGLDAVVHLAGAGIADAKWTAERKRVIRDSRVLPTHALARTLAGLRAKPRVLVCASAIGRSRSPSTRRARAATATSPTCARRGNARPTRRGTPASGWCTCGSAWS